MIYQAVLTTSNASDVFQTPFVGVYHVYLRNIEYHKNVGPLIEEMVQLQSNTLINQTALSGRGNRLVFLNSACNEGKYNDSFCIGKNIRVSGLFDLSATVFPTGAALPAGAGGYNQIAVTLEFEKVGD